MKINVKAFAITLGILWAGMVFSTGLLNLIWNSYAVEFVTLVKSIYPGYKAMRGFLGLITGTIYALTEGVFLGLIFGWLYNKIVGTPK
ncbi:MAG: hypothetical protein A2Y62_02345 [Candidatus Fischerbacteria bacterium RBG_13_37_8]|uniref:Uncharacterized protein n=1 Tax=Candidatus Fischerbacteria bacterium RBG_13_37_8 TaxID=1817863 RepID=A0A1F5VQA2_9BACT|nr:MAG: hypothetical protein A2Y62_02345 [Candidatus Fischerbacteria bacterium RBG_13_37_8]